MSMSLVYDHNEQLKTDATAMSCAADPRTFMSNGPSGWSTVPNWWATREQAALELLPDPLATFREDDLELQRRAALLDVPEVWVSSCAAVAATGTARERAYPLWLLAEFYPVNP